MKIYIPTWHRVDKQATFHNLPKVWQRRVTFVCAPEDATALSREVTPLDANVIPQPKAVKGISQVRQWILEREEGKVLMMDDDLRFSARGKTGIKLYDATPSAIDEGLKTVEYLLDTFSHGAISAREGNNRVEEDLTYIGRPLRALAYNCRAVKELGCRFDRVKLMEDFDMTLQLLRHGCKNFILWALAHDQKGSHLPGGCSTYRTPAMQDTSARDLHRLHPDFVKVITKETKGAWGKDFNHQRTDVRIAWKKAYESAFA